MTTTGLDTDRPRKQADFVVRYALQIFGVVLIVGILIRFFFVSSYVVAGTSMLPSVWPGDFIIASKWRMEKVKRGEIVALRCPHNKEQICMKRVVGLPGDRIEFRAGQLSINGQLALLKPVAPEVEMEIVAGASWLIWPSKQVDSQSAVVVPPQQIYVLNDRRVDTEDSRQWGPISVDLVEGRAERVWLSLDWYEGDDVRSWPRVRWPRILRSIH